MGSSSPGSSVHGILQAGILEQVAMSSSRGSSWISDQTHVTCIGRQILYHCAKELMLLNCGVREDLGVPLTAGRSNQSVLKESYPEYSLEGLMLKLKPQYSGHLM